MNNKRTTKRTLALSLLVMLMCVAMLVGTTFAWFTDSASTAVNKIQAGTLDVALQMATGLNADGSTTWVTAEGRTLNFVKAADHENEAILWEPGCTYVLPELRIVNNGNLALKYKIEISGIVGNAKLLEAIDFTYGDGIDINAEVPLAPNAATEGIVIKGHMKESAGNEYQGLSIDGIAITVYATQCTAEFDSFDNQYDKDALYSVLVAGVNRTEEKAADIDENNKTMAPIALSSGTIPDGTEMFTDSNKQNALTATAITGSLREDIKTTGSGDSVTFDISYSYVDSNTTTTPIHGFSVPLTHTFNLSKGLLEVTAKHSGTPMIKNPDISTLADGEYNYNAATGVLTIKSSTYSEFEVTYKYDFVAATGGQGYTTLAEAAAAAKSGDTITLLRDVTVTAADAVQCTDAWGDPLTAIIPKLNRGVVFDGAGRTITANFGNETDIFVFGRVYYATVKNLTVDFHATDSSIVFDCDNAVFEKVTTKGSLVWTTGNFGAFVVYPFNNLTMTDCVNEAVLQTTSGDVSIYDAVFVGYGLGNGTFRMTNCLNNGSLVCGKAAMLMANWSYGTRVDFVITNCKNNGVIRSTSDGYYGGADKYNYCTSDYWDKAHCLSFTFDDGIKYTSNTATKWYNIDAQGRLIGTGTFEVGPFDSTLSLTKNPDGTLTITPASVSADHYVVSVGTYYGLPNGSCRTYVTETVTGTTTTLKAFGFVSQKWVDAHPNAVSGTLNSFTTYTLDGVTYYLISDEDATDTSPRGPEMISVSAFNGETLVASAPLNVQ